MLVNATLLELCLSVCALNHRRLDAAAGGAAAVGQQTPGPAGPAAGGAAKTPGVGGAAAAGPGSAVGGAKPKCFPEALLPQLVAFINATTNGSIDKVSPLCVSIAT